jgi:hypothetical protein
VSGESLQDQRPHAPWARLYRADLKSGLAYPVRPAEVAQALRGAGVEIASLHLWIASSEGRLGPRRPAGLPLLEAEWQQGSDLSMYQAGGGGLTVYAVPAARRAEIHAVLLREALPSAARWLADAAGRGEAWREMRHERWITLGDAGLMIEDREGAGWSTVRRV